MPEPAVPLSEDLTLCSTGATGSSKAEADCRPADVVQGWLQDEDLEIVGAAPAPGTQGAKVFTLSVRERGEERVFFRAKWRSQTTADLINTPRKELAAFGVQRLFLRPSEWVVPPTTSRCIPLSSYRQHVDAAADASFPQGECVFGFLSYWLEGATDVEGAREAGLIESEQGLFDEDAYRNDDSYRRAAANLNALTHLIDHDDAHSRQFLVLGERGRLRLFSVDNSISFRSVQNPLMLFREDWSKWQVPCLPQALKARLAAITAAQLQQLRALEQFEITAKGWVRLADVDATKAPDSAMGWNDDTFSVGLAAGEIALVEERLRDLELPACP